PPPFPIADEPILPGEWFELLLAARIEKPPHAIAAVEAPRAARARDAIGAVVNQCGPAFRARKQGQPAAVIHAGASSSKSESAPPTRERPANRRSRLRVPAAARSPADDARQMRPGTAAASAIRAL